MNVGAAGLHGIFKQRLQKLYHRCFRAFGLSAEVRQVKSIVAQFVFQFFRQRGNFVSTAIHQIEGIQQFAFPHNGLLDRLFQHPHQFVVGEDVERVGHTYQQFAALFRQYDAAETAGHGFRQLLDQLVVELEVAQLNEWHIQLA